MLKPDTTDFSRVVLQLKPRGTAGLVILLDTTDFSRVEFQFWPSSSLQSRLKLNLHATKVGGI